MSQSSPTREQALEAVKTLINWAGDNSARAALAETPDRVLRSYGEFFSGYNQDPVAMLRKKTFACEYENHGMVLLRDIDFRSCCEHHMLPITGRAYVAYIPNKLLVGISKLARVVRAHALRLQLQERLTQEIAHSIQKGLEPLGVAVMLDARHDCLSTRGVATSESRMITDCFLGHFAVNESLKLEFLQKVK